MHSVKGVSLLTLASFVVSTMSVPAFAGGYQYDARRGYPSEYDPGPAKNSKWVELFGSAPNYRAIGESFLGGDKFRWMFGPMWYRGRLGQNEAKVFVVGQEGAQDENLSNRAFTGSTGTKTQTLLNAAGITRSYLIMNTFVYTINGQLEKDPRFKWLEQGRGSPIVEYRHRLFNNMAATNKDSLSLIIGVGSGGKASVVSWLNANGANCSASGNIAKCDTSAVERKFGLKNKLLVVGVPHPGGGKQGNGGENALKNSIIPGFKAAAKRIADRLSRDRNWLPGDEGAANRAGAVLKLNNYQYVDSPVPFRDFAFGTNWRLGKQGTSSNRDGADQISVFADGVKYGTRAKSCDKPSDIGDALVKNNKGYPVRAQGMSASDLPYEPAKWESGNAGEYDYGPCGLRNGCTLARLLTAWPDFTALREADAPVSDQSFGFGPTYRGRLDNAKLLVLADQGGNDDFFAARALTDTLGQKLQTLLEGTGSQGQYAILRTLPVDTLGQKESEVIAMATDPAVMKARDAILAEVVKSGTKVVVALGSAAQAVAAKSAVLKGMNVVKLSTDDRNWGPAANAIAQGLGTQKTGFYNGKLTNIPRSDLPAGTRWWMGTSGTRAHRGEQGSEYGKFYCLYAPDWVKRLRASSLKPGEADAIEESFRRNEGKFYGPGQADKRGNDEREDRDSDDDESPADRYESDRDPS
ncbi:MAG: hypothetical protein AB7P04_13825 [Bacteriovoracia bacterium]